MSQLGSNAYVGSSRTVHTRIIDLYHGESHADDQQRITALFSNNDSILRCVVCTVAFGMGVSMSNVRHVIHWGPPKDILSYWQQVGRCARDGQQGSAQMFLYPRSVHKSFVDADMIELCKTNTECLRKKILKHLFVDGMPQKELDYCSDVAECCTFCSTH